MFAAFRSPRTAGFASVSDSSAHGSNASQHGLFTISNNEEDGDDDCGSKDDDDVVVLNLADASKQHAKHHVRSDDPVFVANEESKPMTVWSALALTWSALTFSWVRPLIALGNSRPLEQSDLYPLAQGDTAKGVSPLQRSAQRVAFVSKPWTPPHMCVDPPPLLLFKNHQVYGRFRHQWRIQLRASLPDPATADAPAPRPPSFLLALWHAFGGPFMAVGGLKLVHDRCVHSHLTLVLALHWLSFTDIYTLCVSLISLPLVSLPHLSSPLSLPPLSLFSFSLFSPHFSFLYAQLHVRRADASEPPHRLSQGDLARLEKHPNMSLPGTPTPYNANQPQVRHWPVWMC